MKIYVLLKEIADETEIIGLFKEHKLASYELSRQMKGMHKPYRLHIEEFELIEGK